MSTTSFARLVVLAAIWGASFLFMRIGVPILGPVMLIEFRVGLAAVFLLLMSFILHKRLHLQELWKHYLVIGLFNSALPFLLFGIAAMTLSASMLSILNATSPLWGALIGAALNRQSLSAKTLTGLALGIVGVWLLVGVGKSNLQPGTGMAVACALGATFSYGVATTYAKSAKQVDPFSNAHGSMWAASFLVLPAVPFFPNPASPNITVLLSVLLLGVVCSGIAYLLYFRLIADLGATSALTVTFLIPVFGILWGHLVLGEPVSWQTGFGAVIVFAGTALVTGFSPSALWKKQVTAHG
jgi:drug/metabolite transporter (DMT)-like permease